MKCQSGLLGKLVLDTGFPNGVDQIVALLDGVCGRYLGHNMDTAVHFGDRKLHLNIGAVE